MAIRYGPSDGGESQAEVVKQIKVAAAAAAAHRNSRIFMWCSDGREQDARTVVYIHTHTFLKVAV